MERDAERELEAHNGIEFHFALPGLAISNAA
jgi:hypothetical protein